MMNGLRGITQGVVFFDDHTKWSDSEDPPVVLHPPVVLQLGLMSLPKLREVLDDAHAFGCALGDWTVYDHLKAAIKAAEKHEPADSFKICPNCKTKHQGRGNYCGLDCAEEDGATEK